MKKKTDRVYGVFQMLHPDFDQIDGQNELKSCAYIQPTHWHPLKRLHAFIHYVSLPFYMVCNGQKQYLQHV